jgi:hypothetical protein
MELRERNEYISAGRICAFVIVDGDDDDRKHQKEDALQINSSCSPLFCSMVQCQSRSNIKHVL